MNRSASPIRGLILRAWREHAGLSLSALAARAHMGISTLSMWEHGARGRRMTAGLETAQRIAHALGLPQEHAAALIGLWQSGDSVRAQPPRHYWAHNFAEPSGPAWVWLRPANRREPTVAKLWLGVSVRKQLELGRSAAGILMQLRATVPNPALEIRFNRPAWADFGAGEIPADVARKLGIKLIEANDLIRGQHSWPELLREVAEQTGFQWPLFAAQVGYVRSRWAPRSLVAADPKALSAEIAVDSRGMITTQLLMPPGQLRRLREARGMGRHTAAAAATALSTRGRITPKTIEIIEAGGRLPEGNMVISRLDMVYQANGHVGVERVFATHSAPGDSARPVGILFPVFWRGPVWLQFNGPADSASGLTELSWGIWGCRHLVRPGAVLTTRKA